MEDNSREGEGETRARPGIKSAGLLKTEKPGDLLVPCTPASENSSGDDDANRRKITYGLLTIISLR